MSNKHNNQSGRPWIKYLLIAAGGFLLYRNLRSRGFLGGPPPPPPPPMPTWGYAQPPVVLQAPIDFVPAPAAHREPGEFGIDGEPLNARKNRALKKTRAAAGLADDYQLYASAAPKPKSTSGGPWNAMKQHRPWMGAGLGGNGDTSYEVHKPSPVVEKIRQIVSTPARHPASDPMVFLRQIYQKYALQEERAMQSVEQARAVARALAQKQNELNRRKADLDRLRELQRQKGGSQYNVQAAKASLAWQQTERDISSLKRELEVKKDLVLMQAEPLRKAEQELLDVSSDVIKEYEVHPQKFEQQYKPEKLNDFLVAAALATKQPVVASEPGGAPER